MLFRIVMCDIHDNTEAVVLEELGRGEALEYVEERLETGMFDGSRYEKVAVNIWSSGNRQVKIEKQ